MSTIRGRILIDARAVSSIAWCRSAPGYHALRVRIRRDIEPIGDSVGLPIAEQFIAGTRKRLGRKDSILETGRERCGTESGSRYVLSLVIG
jgi:hypothetical protein